MPDLVVKNCALNAYGCHNNLVFLKGRKWRNRSKFSTFYIVWCEIYFQSANYTVFRCDAMVVFDLLTMIADETDVSLDSEKEEALEWPYIQLAFSPKREKGQPFNIDDCSEVDFELLFQVSL